MEGKVDSVISTQNYGGDDRITMGRQNGLITLAAATILSTVHSRLMRFAYILRNFSELAYLRVLHGGLLRGHY
jgi:hypothetical protein